MNCSLIISPCFSCSMLFPQIIKIRQFALNDLEKWSLFRNCSTCFLKLADNRSSLPQISEQKWSSMNNEMSFPNPLQVKECKLLLCRAKYLKKTFGCLQIWDPGVITLVIEDKYLYLWHICEPGQSLIYNHFFAEKRALMPLLIR